MSAPLSICRSLSAITSPAAEFCTTRRVRCKIVLPTAPPVLLLYARSCSSLAPRPYLAELPPIFVCRFLASLPVVFLPEDYLLHNNDQHWQLSWTQQRTLSSGLLAFAFYLLWMVAASCKPWEYRTFFQDDIPKAPGHSLRQVLFLLCLYTLALLSCVIAACVRYFTFYVVGS